MSYRQLLDCGYLLGWIVEDFKHSAHDFGKAMDIFRDLLIGLFGNMAESTRWARRGSTGTFRWYDMLSEIILGRWRAFLRTPREAGA